MPLIKAYADVFTGARGQTCAQFSLSYYTLCMQAVKAQVSLSLCMHRLAQATVV